MIAPPTRPCHVRLLALLVAAIPLSLLADAAVDEQVKTIRARYNEIEGAKLRRETVTFESRDEPLSGTCAFYYEGDALVKVHLAYVAGDHGGSDEYFYYDRDGLFFVLASDSLWSFTGKTLPDGVDETVETLIEDRLYLVRGKVVRHLRKKATAKDPARLPTLLGEAKNESLTDPERAGSLLRHGRGLPSGKTADALERLLVGAE